MTDRRTTWVRTEPNVQRNPKFADGTVYSFTLWMAALGYANEHGSNGIVPKSRLLLLTSCMDWGPKKRKTAVKYLLDSGSWEDRGSSWFIHDYEQYQGPALRLPSDPADPSVSPKSPEAKRSKAYRDRKRAERSVTESVTEGVTRHVTNSVTPAVTNTRSPSRAGARSDPIRSDPKPDRDDRENRSQPPLADKSGSSRKAREAAAAAAAHEQAQSVEPLADPDAQAILVELAKHPEFVAQANGATAETIAGMRMTSGRSLPEYFEAIQACAQAIKLDEASGTVVPREVRTRKLVGYARNAGKRRAGGGVVPSPAALRARPTNLPSDGPHAATRRAQARAAAADAERERAEGIRKHNERIAAGQPLARVPVLHSMPID